jgi:hypothetical protein
VKTWIAERKHGAKLGMAISKTIENVPSWRFLL